MTQRNKQDGLTIFELLIGLVIVVIIAAIGTPTYFLYIKKAKYSEVLKSVEVYKSTTADCRTLYATSNTDASEKCVAGKSGIPAAFTGNTDIGDKVKSITVTFDSNYPNATKISITPFNHGGISTDDTLTINVVFDIDNSGANNQKIRFDIFGPACGPKQLVPNCSTDASTTLYPS